MTLPSEIELFFDVGSAYSYLATTQVDAIERRTGVKVRMRPFLLGGVFKATGNSGPAQVAAKAKWMLGDLAAWAEAYEVPFRFPSRFPLMTLPTQRAITACERVIGEDAARKLALGLFAAYWTEDRDVTDRQVMADVAASVGLDGASIASATDAQETKDLLRERTESAVARGAFGAPTFFVGDAMFFGNDRIALVERMFALPAR
jgi:2-hydroxychromene-2-carboxylate isomerase